MELLGNKIKIFWGIPQVMGNKNATSGFFCTEKDEILWQKSSNIQPVSPNVGVL